MNDRHPVPDMLRGFSVILIILSHTFYFFVDKNFDYYPYAGRDWGVFFFLLINQFSTSCFIFLAGISAGLAQFRFTSQQELSKFLLKRGILIILIEFTIVHFLWRFSFTPTLIHFEALFIIGLGLLTLAFVRFLPRRILCSISLLLIAGHNLFDYYSPFLTDGSSPIWTLLNVGGQTSVGIFELRVSYPIFPWIGVLWLGYLCTPMLRDEVSRKKFRLYALGALVLFLILRVGGFYGDPNPWIPGQTILASLASLFGTFKYGGSFHHHLWTIGTIIFLATLSYTHIERYLKWTMTLGRTSLFCYLFHLFSLHSLAVIFFMYSDIQHDWLFSIAPRKSMPIGAGITPNAVFLLGTSVTYVTYLISRFVLRIKSERKYSFLRYL